MEVRKCVSGEKEGGREMTKTCRDGLSSRERGIKKQVNDRRKTRKRQLRGSALSSQLL